LYPISPDVFLFLSGRRDGAFRVIPVTSDSGLLVSRSLRLALNRRNANPAHSLLRGYPLVDYLLNPTIRPKL